MSTPRFLELRRIGGHTAFLAFVLAFLGSAFAAGAHWISIPHRLCEVHGTIEHGDADAAAPGTRDHAPTSPGDPVVRADDGTHEECSIGACARLDALTPAHVDVATGFLEEPRGLAAVSSDAAPSVPLLLLAPSRSPPV